MTPPLSTVSGLSARTILGVDLGLALLVIAGRVTSQQLEQSGNNESQQNWPVGDARRCQELFRLTKFDVKRSEVLPGLGWDNLRNKEAGIVVSYKYSQCKVTDDGTLLIPDNVFTVKASSLVYFSEMIDNWHNASSITSNTINVEAGLKLPIGEISGKYSEEHGKLKLKQIEEKAVTTRAQLRYYRYEAKLQPDATLSPQFKGRLLSIAANVELNRTEQAVYEGQLLVRDFGTHVLTSITAGAGLVKDDYLKRDLVQSKAENKASILASASASFFHFFHLINTAYVHKTDSQDMDKYEEMVGHSSVKIRGGPMFKALNMTLNDWVNEVDKNLVPMDRAGDPLYLLVTPQTLPELPPTTVAAVEKVVRQSIEQYYEMNVIAGCTKLGAPNFSFSANFDDGSCHSEPTILKFGGVYQECTVSGNYLKQNPCDGLTQTNLKTGDFSCLPSYTPVRIRHGSRNSQTENSKSCHRCWLLWTCCDPKSQYSEANITTYWCAATGPVDQNSGYLFGGLYTSHTENLVTGTPGCPPLFNARKLFTDLSICISDDHEFGAKYSVPFGGFYSCEAGNPLSQVPSSDALEAPAPNFLRAFKAENGGPQSWPRKCPVGYRQHLAASDLGCAIHYCVRSGSLSDPNLPPIKRPPFMEIPEDPDNLVKFDKESKTWINNDQAKSKPQKAPIASSQYSNDFDDDDRLSPGTAAGLSVGITLACVVLVAAVIVVIQRRRAKRGVAYKLLADESHEPQA